MQNLIEMGQFEKAASHIAADSLDFVGRNNENTNAEDATIYGIPSSPATTLNPIAPTQNGGFTKMCFSVEVSDDSPALADFALYAQPHKNAFPVKILSGSDWGTVAGILRHKVGSINTLASGTTGYASVEPGPNYAYGFAAQSGGTTVLTNGTFAGSATGWALGTGWSYSGSGGGCVVASSASSTLKQLKASMGTPWTSGLLYQVGFTVSNYSAGYLTVGTNTTPSQYLDADGNTIQISADGTYYATVLADSHADGLVITGVGFFGTVDTVSLKQCAIVTVRGSLYR
jgi:hypothetical protein